MLRTTQAESSRASSRAMTYHDIEGGNSKLSPIISENASIKPDPKNERERSQLPRLLDFFSGGIYTPNSSISDPIELLLNTEDPAERDRLTENWKNNRLNELSFVGVVAALLAGVLTSTGSWPNILPNGEQSPWPVRTSWYCGIILSLFSILSAAEQTIRLYRMSSHRDGLKLIRNLLARSNGKRRVGQLKPSTGQIYTWQIPVMFLTTATICMIVGMFAHVWSATLHRPPSEWWSSDSKVALTFTIVAIISIGIFFSGQLTLYAPNNGED